MLDDAPPSDGIGRIHELPDAAGQYVDTLATRFGPPRPLEPAHALDCANGATHRVAPEILTRLGAESTSWRPSPMGATSTIIAAPPTSRRSPSAVREGGHHAGFAFDGDGDRVLAVDSTGASRRRRRAIALAARHLRATGVSRAAASR
jgi:phosphoglucosamine mutase